MASDAVSKPRVVDLRSDTVTRPTPDMLAAMMGAAVGDDVWGDDPTVNHLQEVAAEMFGMEAALFCPSGTMTNQIAIKVHTQPGDELICADTAHIYLYEGGGIAFNSGVQAKLLPGDQGRISAAQIAKAINADDQHFPTTRLVCLENTTNKGGGCCYSLESMQEISSVCRERGLRLHLDGARIFNAVVRAGYRPRDIGPVFDSISVCLSKGLGCPVGSLLLGSQAFIQRARRVRKVLGGGMRQAGFLAAAGLYALEHHVARLEQDHNKAERLGQALGRCSFVASVSPVETNIVIFTIAEPHDPKQLIEQFRAAGIMISQMAERMLRCVTHLDVSDHDIDEVCKALDSL